MIQLVATFSNQKREKLSLIGERRYMGFFSLRRFLGIRTIPGISYFSYKIGLEVDVNWERFFSKLSLTDTGITEGMLNLYEEISVIKMSLFFHPRYCQHLN